MNANNENILYVKLSPTLASSHHCRLPSHIISSHGLQFIESLVVVEIIASNNDDDDNFNLNSSSRNDKSPPLFVTWIKGMYSTDSNTIELSDKTIRDHDAACSSKYQIKDGDMVTIKIILSLPYAMEVTLSPLSSTDWDIVSSQASYIENNLLKSVSIIYLHQILVVPISPSIKAKLVVQQILLQSLKSISIDDKNATSSQTTHQLARINNSTSLVIAPYESKVDTISNTSRRLVLPSSSSGTTTATATAGRSEANKHSSSHDSVGSLGNGIAIGNNACPDNSTGTIDLSKYSSTIPLRVLPQCYQSVDTSLLSNKGSKVIVMNSENKKMMMMSKGQTVDDYEDNSMRRMMNGDSRDGYSSSVDLLNDNYLDQFLDDYPYQQESSSSSSSSS